MQKLDSYTRDTGLGDGIMPRILIAEVWAKWLRYFNFRGKREQKGFNFLVTPACDFEFSEYPVLSSNTLFNRIRQNVKEICFLVTYIFSAILNNLSMRDAATRC